MAKTKIVIEKILKPHDPVSNPWHYRQYSIDCVDVIESWNLGFHLGNTLKYICRAPHKGTEIQDLKKAAWYLARKIEQLEKTPSDKPVA